MGYGGLMCGDLDHSMKTSKGKCPKGCLWSFGKLEERIRGPEIGIGC